MTFVIPSVATLRGKVRGAAGWAAAAAEKPRRVAVAAASLQVISFPWGVRVKEYYDVPRSHIE
jgi:hypothetical protein